MELGDGEAVGTDGIVGEDMDSGGEIEDFSVFCGSSGVRSGGFGVIVIGSSFGMMDGQPPPPTECVSTN